MKLIPMLLVLATVASLAPSVSAQDGLNRGRKGSDPKPSGPSRSQNNGDRGRQQGNPSNNDRSAAPRTDDRNRNP